MGKYNAFPRWTSDARQQLIDEVVRGQSVLDLKPILGHTQDDMTQQLRKISGGGIKGAPPEGIFLPCKWKDRSLLASLDHEPFGWQEDVELVKWLYHHCTGLNGKVFDDSRSLKEIRRRPIEIEDECKELPKEKGLLPTEGNANWKDIAEAASAKNDGGAITPVACYATYLFGSGMTAMGDHKSYKRIRKEQPSQRPRVYPEGPPSNMIPSDSVFDDPTLLQALRLDQTLQEKAQLIKNIPIINVLRLKEKDNYPPRRQWIYSEDMGVENKRLWTSQILEKKKGDSQRLRRTIAQLDKTKLRGIVRRDDSAQIQIDGEMSLFVYRNARLVPDHVIQEFRDVMTQYELPSMDCNQKGKGPDFNFVLPIDGKTHVLTGLEKAPPSGIAAISYAKDTHNESSSVNWVISLTTDSDMSISGGNFYSAEAGHLVERAPNTLVVHRVTDWHGTTLMDMSPTDMTPHSWRLSLDFPSNLSKLWSKNRIPADTNAPAAKSPDEGSDRERSVVFKRAPALTSKRAETSIAAQPPVVPAKNQSAKT
ncbi:MAG: hypothetical protein Q9212_000574 [Teloschistes hypoglaucus]